MPDPTKATISATQAAGLFNVSPYVTRWMLYQHFAKGLEIDPAEDSRMSWGKKLQPLLLAQAGEDLALEVRPNDESYVRLGMLGCTRDAEIICPDRGPGALETKCVFDYRTWMGDWLGGSMAPKHYEIQLQQQMLVGDGERSYRWGVIAAWVAGEMHYFERKPLPELWGRLDTEAKQFFADVEKAREPDPFGDPVELPWLNQLFPVTRGKVIDLTADDAAAAIALQYRDAKEQEIAGSRTAEPLRAKLLALAKDADELALPSGVSVRIRPHGKGKRITVYSPDTLPRARETMLTDLRGG